MNFEGIGDTLKGAVSSAGKLIEGVVDKYNQLTEYPRPICKIEVNGKDITAEVEARLISINLTDNRGMEVDTLDIQLSDHDGLLAIPPRKAEIDIWLGNDKTGLLYKGLYYVDETEHSGAPDVLNIRARSADLKEELKTKREQSYKDATLREILQSIADRHALFLRSDASIDGQKVTQFDQANESDANVLTRLAEQFDATISIKAGYLLCMKTGDAKTSDGLGFETVNLTRQDGDSHRFLQADRNSYSGVKAYYYEPNSADKKQAIAGGGDNLKELRHVYSDEQSALRAARAELSRLLRGTATLSYTLAVGRADLFPELTYALTGVKDEIDAIVWLGSNVQHSFTTSSYTTSLELENQLPDDDVTLLADLADSYTGIIAYYKDGKGKQQKMEKGDQERPKRLPHLYSSKAAAKKAVEREWKKLDRKTLINVSDNSV